LRIIPFDQFNLPVPFPLLDLQFAPARFLQIVMDLVTDKERAAMLLGESAYIAPLRC